MHPKFQEVYGNYKVTKLSDLKEIRSTLIELEHQPSGAQIMHIACDDDENLFNLSFRTWPDKSNGAAHILEHTVLCGSEKFPIRDPFFSMSRRSLNTFMNAMTGADFTCYPASALVPKDFYNLLDVYLDAVFKPKLTYLSFLQEGHRLEFIKPDDPNSGLTIKGIVYNEMKGALSTPDARLGESLMRELFPDLPYGFNSGGDPAEIAKLEYKELLDFHKKFYHPSRCLFFFYGNLPLERHLDFLEENAFKNIERAPLLDPLPKQPRFSQKKEKVLYYPTVDKESDNDKTLVAFGWLTCHILEQVELLALNVLDLALMGTDAAPLKQALLKSNLCKQADSVIDNEMSEVPFLLICKGCKNEEMQAIEDLIQVILKEIVENGLPQNLIEGSLHQLEMSRTEITGNSIPYGLSLFFRSALLKQHGGNPEDGLNIHSLFQSLRQKLEDPNYLKGLIQKHFLDNKHLVAIEMRPDKDLPAKELEEEKKLISTYSSKLKDAGIQKVLEEAKELEVYQESAKEENLDILPKVGLGDVKKQGSEYPLAQEKVGDLTIFSHLCFTNDLTYVDLLFDLPKIEEEDLPYLRLFTLFLSQVGSGGRTYQEHLEYLLEHTGGVGVSLDLFLQVDDPEAMKPALVLKSKALDRKLDKLFPLLKDMVQSPDFTDIARLRELLGQHFLGMENSIHQSSLRYAVNLAAKGFSKASKIINYWYGLDYYWSLKKIIHEFETSPAKLLEKFAEMQEKCLGLANAHLVLSCDTPAYDRLHAEKFYGLTELGSKKFVPWDSNYNLEKVASQGRLTASPVAFTAMLMPSLPYSHPSSMYINLGAQMMDNLILHRKVREQGGAYGAGAVNSALSGQFYFYSYRDPHLASTIQAFKEAAQMVASGQFDEDDLEEAKLEIFQDLDTPLPPGSRASSAYSRLRSGRTPEIRQYFREGLFKAKKADLSGALDKYIFKKIEEAVIVSFAGNDFFEKENAKLINALPTYPI